MGPADTFTVVLDAQPASDVVISVSSGDTGEATVSPATLTFTSTNWDTAQTVTVTGVNDSLIDSSQTSTITLSIVDSISNDDFDGAADQTVTVTGVNDDLVDGTQTTILTFWLVRRYLRRQRMVIQQGLLLLSRVGLLE